MVDKEALKKELGLDRFTPRQQDEILEQYTFAVGAAMSEGLSEEQLGEFTEIVNGNDEVITRWLEANAPNYRDDPNYHELEIGYRDDPEKVPADKVYASIAWVRVNKPDLEAVIERIKDEFRTAVAEMPAE